MKAVELMISRCIFEWHYERDLEFGGAEPYGDVEEEESLEILKDRTSAQIWISEFCL